MRRTTVNVFNIQERKDGRPKPHLVRWTVAGREYTHGETHKKAAQAYMADLITAARNPAEKWNRHSGEPVSWSAPSEIDVATFCRSYAAREWGTLEQGSRLTLAETLCALIEASAADKAPRLDAAGRKAIKSWLSVEAHTELSEGMRTWIDRWVPLLSELDIAALERIDARMRVGIRGKALFPTTASRRVATSKRVIRRAVRMQFMDDINWPTPELGESSRKANAPEKQVSNDVLSPADLHELLGAIPSKFQVATFMYRAMTAIGAYAGLRPAETVALEVSDLTLDEGWGSISVTKAWVGVGDKWGGEDVGKTKTATVRDVPIPPVLVTELSSWLERSGIEAGPLFRTRNNKRPTQSNWGRVLKRACLTAELKSVTPYGLRHTCASYMSAAGVPIAEAAARMGHSPETMLRWYTHRIAGHEGLSNDLLDKFLG